MIYLFAILFFLYAGSAQTMETAASTDATTVCAEKLVEAVFHIAKYKYGFSNSDDVMILLKRKHSFAQEENPTEAGLILQCKNNVPVKIHMPQGTLEFAELRAQKNEANALLMQDILKITSASTVDVETKDDSLTYYRIKEFEDQKLPYARFKTANPSKNSGMHDDF